MKFGVVVPPNAPFEVLEQRWRAVEEAGFDQLWTEDHTRDYRVPHGPWFDGWTVLTAMAERTSTVRIGVLVSNPILRHPVLLAKEAAAVDRLSEGRVEIAIGTGIAGFDHEAMGVDRWAPRERVERYAEYVTIVDELLSADGPYAFEGRFYRTKGVEIDPPTLQRPRPPITVGGQSPTVRGVAAERADRWNTHGPFGRSAEEIAEITGRQNAEMDDRCAGFGRDPSAVKRSLLMFGELDAWSDGDALARIVSLFVPVGVEEFVLFWPPGDGRDMLEWAATKVIPTLQEDR